MPLILPALAIALLGELPSAGLGLHPDRAQALYAEAMGARPPLHRALLVEATREGSLQAAARMIELSMFDEMARVEMRTPEIRAWVHSSQVLSGMTGRQVYGALLLNWAVRHEAELGDELEQRVLEAREHLSSASLEHPCLRNEMAWTLAEHRPVDLEGAAALREGLADLFHRSAETRDPLVRGSFLWWSGRLSEQWEDAVEHYQAAAAAFAAGRDLEGQASMLIQQAGDLARPEGSFDRAVKLLERATELCIEGGYPLRQASAIATLAWCRRPDRAPGGSWSLSASLYEQAAELCASVDELEQQAGYLKRQAECLLPDNNPEGSWERAVPLLERSAELLGLAGEPLQQSRVLRLLGRCLDPKQNPAGSWATAAEVFGRALELAEAEGSWADAAFALEFQAFLHLPGNHPQGSFPRAAELLGRAAAFHGRAENWDRQALDLGQEAHFLLSDSEGSPVAAAEVYARAEEAAGRAGNLERQAQMLRSQAFCLEPTRNPDGSWQRAADLYARAARVAAEWGDDELTLAHLADAQRCQLAADEGVQSLQVLATVLKGVSPEGR